MPDASELAAWGLRPEDFAADSPDEIIVWPDTETAITTFINLGTQWRYGFQGRTGLDYGAIEPTLRLTGVPASEWPDVFHSIRVMECEVIDMIEEQRANNGQ